VENAAKLAEVDITKNMDIVQEGDTTGIAVNVDVVAAVEVIANVIVPADIKVDIPVGTEKVHGEDSRLKKKKEKSSRSTRKS